MAKPMVAVQKERVIGVNSTRSKMKIAILSGFNPLVCRHGKHPVADNSTVPAESAANNNCRHAERSIGGFFSDGVLMPIVQFDF
jgi:hypothetical protein